MKRPCLVDFHFILGDAPEDFKPMYYPPLAPQNPKPTIHAHEPKRPKPVNPISLEPPPKPKPKPVVVSSWVDVLPNECGFKGNVLPNTIKDKIVNGEAVGIEANPWQVRWNHKLISKCNFFVRLQSWIKTRDLCGVEEALFLKIMCLLLRIVLFHNDALLVAMENGK